MTKPRYIIFLTVAFISGSIVALIFTTHVTSGSKSAAIGKPAPAAGVQEPALSNPSVDHNASSQELEFKNQKINELERQIARINKEKEDSMRQSVEAARRYEIISQKAAPQQKVTDAGGNLVYEYDRKNGVLKYDPSKSVILAQDGKVFLNKNEEIAAGLKSTAGDVKAQLNFTNSTPDDVYLFWIDYNGKPVLYEHIQPGATAVRPTYMSHPWVVTDAVGNRIGNVLPELPNQTETIPIEKGQGSASTASREANR